MELGKAFNIPEDKLTALISEDTKPEDLKSDELTKLFNDAYRDKMSSIMKTHELDKKKSKDEGFKAAERTVKTDVEKLIKEKLKLDEADAETLEDLLDTVATKFAERPSKKAAELTDDDVKKHPAFIQAEKGWKTQLKKAQDDGEKAVNDLKAGYAKEQAFGTVSKDALAFFDELKPILSQDPAKAARQRESILERLKGYDFEIVDGVTVISKDGTVLEDDLKNKVSLKSLVKEVADPYFDFQVADSRQAPNGGAGGNNPGGGNGGNAGLKYTGALPKTQQELLSISADDKIPLEQRQELMTWGEKANLPVQ